MEDIDLIEAYLNDELSDKEKETYLNRLQSDQDFAKKVENYKMITDGIRQMADEELFIQKMNTWDQDDSNQHQRFFKSSKPLRFAAVLAPILLGSILFYFYTTSKTINNQDLFALYFSPYEDVISNRSALDNEFGLAMSAYNSEEYHKAIDIFEEVLSKKTDDEKATIIQFYLTMSYLSIGQVEKAEVVLNQVVKGDDLLYKEVSEWYLALVYLKQNQGTKLQEQLDLIQQNTGHLYYKKSMELREQWNE